MRMLMSPVDINNKTKGDSMSYSVLEREELSEGKVITLNRNKIKGVRKPIYNVMIIFPQLGVAPEIHDCNSKDEAYKTFSNIVASDVMDV